VRRRVIVLATAFSPPRSRPREAVATMRSAGSTPSPGAPGRSAQRQRGPARRILATGSGRIRNRLVDPGLRSFLLAPPHNPAGVARAGPSGIPPHIVTAENVSASRAPGGVGPLASTAGAPRRSPRSRAAWINRGPPPTDLARREDGWLFRVPAGLRSRGPRLRADVGAVPQARGAGGRWAGALVPGCGREDLIVHLRHADHGGGA